MDFVANYVEITEPTSYDGALESPQQEEWRKAIDDELKSHEKNSTWKIIDKPENVKLLDTKWVFKTQKLIRNLENFSFQHLDAYFKPYRAFFSFHTWIIYF